MILQSFLSTELDPTLKEFQKTLSSYSKKYDSTLPQKQRIKDVLLPIVRDARKAKVDMEGKESKAVISEFVNTYADWILRLRIFQKANGLILPEEFGKLLSRDLRYIKKNSTSLSVRVGSAQKIAKTTKALGELLSVNIVANNTSIIIQKRKQYQAKYESILSRPCTPSSQFHLVFMPVSISFSGNALRDTKILDRFNIKHDVLSIDSKRDKSEIVYHDMPVLVFNSNLIRERIVDDRLEKFDEQIEKLKQVRKNSTAEIKHQDSIIETLNSDESKAQVLKARKEKIAEYNEVEKQIENLRNRISKITDSAKLNKAQITLDALVKRQKALRSTIRLRTKQAKQSGLDSEYTKAIDRRAALQSQLDKAVADIKTVNASRKKAVKDVSEKSEEVLRQGLFTIIDQINANYSENLTLISDTIHVYKGGNSLALLMPTELRNVFDSLQSGGLKVHSWEIPWKSGADYTKIKALNDMPSTRGGK